MAGRRVAVQLYPDNPNAPLLDFLAGAGAVADPVLPYAYASSAEDARVLETLEAMAAGQVDLVVFTSTPQVRRLVALAEAAGRQADAGARRCPAPASPRSGRWSRRRSRPPAARVAVMPEDSFHMKPMVTAILAALAVQPAA